MILTDRALIRALAEAEAATYSGAAPTWTDAARTWQVFHSVVLGINCFAWEGTMDDAEWLEDFNPLEVGTPELGPIHAPTLANVRAALPFITATLDSLGKPPCYVVGHSKGAREAPVCHAELKLAGYTVLAGAYLEPPRPGGPELGAYLADQVTFATQTYNSHGSDIVTLVPDGPEWINATSLTRLQVPDSFDIRAKHVMAGVLTGLTAAGY